MIDKPVTLRDILITSLVVLSIVFAALWLYTPNQLVGYPTFVVADIDTLAQEFREGEDKTPITYVYYKYTIIPEGNMLAFYKDNQALPWLTDALTLELTENLPLYSKITLK